MRECSPLGYLISTERGGVVSLTAVLYFISLLPCLGGMCSSSAGIRQESEVEGKSSKICFSLLRLAGV